MKVTSVIVLSLMLGVLGTWAQGKKLTDKQIAAGIVLLLMFATADELTPDLANAFAWLVLATTASNYAVPLFTKLGVLTAGNTPAKPANKLPGAQPGNGVGGRGPAVQ